MHTIEDGFGKPVTYLDSPTEPLPDDGRVVVHNHIQPQAELGMNGFRAWLAKPSYRIEPCTCAWAPNLGAHYRVRPGARNFH